MNKPRHIVFEDGSEMIIYRTEAEKAQAERAMTIANAVIAEDNSIETWEEITRP